MGHAIRKARKKAGEKAPLKKEKVPTPPAERSYVTAPVMGVGGTKFANQAKPRSEKKIEKFLARFTPEPASSES
jgi:hypothetical protein